MPSLPVLPLLLSLLLLPTPISTYELNNQTSPTHRFRSRPDLHPPILTILISNPTLILPGYIFLAPYRNLDPAPYIYTSTGELIWSGAGSGGPKTAHAPKVCQYGGQDHLCFFQGEQQKGYSRGHGVILNKHYQVVKTVESTGSGAVADMHEFEVHAHPGSGRVTAVVTVYQTRGWDLSGDPRWDGGEGMGYIQDSVFQEVDVETGELVFEWRSLDHVDPGLSWTLPGTTDTSGDGLSAATGWDYFHINSVDKNGEGDYLVSARHVSAIYKISGKDGGILWQLGGSRPTVQCEGFDFSYQHHARWLSENGTHSCLSFYDNASNSFNRSSDLSTALIICIDHTTDTARRYNVWPSPLDTRLSAGSQGSLQMLRGGYAHIGWGEHAYFSEHTWDGEVALYGKLADRESDVMIYRSGKYNWTGLPKTKPALVTYSLARNSSMGFFVSWNGATEVVKWRFHAGDTAKGPWKMVGSRVKDGFETEFWAVHTSMWSFAEAMDKDGRILERSEIARTFIPGDKLSKFCDERGCPDAKPTPDEAKVAYETPFRVPEDKLSSSRGFDTAHYYQEMETNLHSPKLLTSLLCVGLAIGVCLGVWFLLSQKEALLPLVKKTSMIKQQMMEAVHSGGQYAKLRGEEMEHDGFASGRWQERASSTSRMYS